MKEKKNIDQFFKDRFENFEVNPPENIWENIEEKLQKKKKRRVIPFWWYSSGIAALFVIGLFVFNNYYTVEIHPVNDVVIENNSDNVPNSEIENPTINNTTFPNQEEVVSQGSNNKTKTEENNVYINKGTSNEVTNSTIVTTEDNSRKNVINESDSKGSNAYSTLVSIENKTIKKVNSEKQNLVNQKNETTIITNQTSIATKSIEIKNKKNSTFEPSKNSEKVTEVENIIIEKQENIVQENSNLNQNKSEMNKENNIDLGRIAMKNQDNVATKGEVNTSKDSAAIASVETNELEELLKEKETQIALDQKMNRWQVTPNLAPIYFGSFNNGSPLDSNLDENTKSYNNNLSYGVAVNYAINSKIKIRTGINSFTVDYNTNDIVFFQTNNARMMQNVEPTIEGSFIEIIPIKNLNTSSFNRLANEQNTGVLNQRMGYIEMPMEVSYRLMESKFSIDLLGGMSTMFLSKNEVFLETDEVNVKVGEATNLNPIHFSTNFGVGLNYGFFKNFQARIEPTFKYQLNTFTRDSQNFKPYIFGIYTGISFNF